jgi:hypothetical protein
MNKIGALVLALIGAVVQTDPAAAQFYDLDGRFQCLSGPALCLRPATDWPDPLPPPPAKKSSARPKPAAEHPAAAPDLRRALWSRLEARRPAPGDIALLHDRARAGAGWALELLAWCHLEGVGVPRDPVQAYLLYSAAASVGVAHARENQSIIYETDLTSEQRQQALMIENSVMLPRPE